MGASDLSGPAQRHFVESLYDDWTLRAKKRYFKPFVNEDIDIDGPPNATIFKEIDRKGIKSVTIKCERNLITTK